MCRIRIVSVALTWLLIFAAQEARAQADQTIYSDALGAGWQDWSWCARDFESTDFIHSGTRSAKVTYTAAWQGFYLRHTSLDSSGYTDLVFWIHGGIANGRNITI